METQKHEWLFICLSFFETIKFGDLVYTDQEDDYTIDFNEAILDKFQGIPSTNNFKILLINIVSNVLIDKIETGIKIYEKDVKGNRVAVANTFSTSFRIQNKNSLEILLKFCKEKYPSEQVMLEVYGHGSMFGIYATTHFINNAAYKQKFINWLQSPVKIKIGNSNSPFLQTIIKKFTSLNNAETKANYIIQNLQQHYLKHFDQVVEPTNPQDFERFDILTNEDFSTAIENAFGKIEFLIFSNCVMQNSATQYAFKNTVKYLVAPASGIAYPCFNERFIIANIQTNSNITHSQIAALMMDSFVNNNLDYNDATLKVSIDQFVVAAVCLEGIEKVFDQIENVIAYFEKQLTDGTTKEQFSIKMYNALSQVFGLETTTNTGATVIDICQLLATKQFQLDKTIAACLLALNALAKAYSYSYLGSNSFKGFSKYYSKQNFSGFAVYLPQKKGLKNEYLHPFVIAANYNSAFEKKYGWYKKVADVYLNL